MGIFWNFCTERGGGNFRLSKREFPVALFPTLLCFAICFADLCVFSLLKLIHSRITKKKKLTKFVKITKDYRLSTVALLKA